MRPNNQNDASGSTHLLVWNPDHYEWPDLHSLVEKVRNDGHADFTWSCGRVRNIEVASRFFLIRVASEPRGIVGAGRIVSEPREEAHWDSAQAAEGKTARRIDIRFDSLNSLPLIRRPDLDVPPFDGFRWDAQTSGLRIPDEIASALEIEWHERVRARQQGEEERELPEQVIARWSRRLKDVRSDGRWVERQRLRCERREAIVDELGEAVQRFAEGKSKLSSLLQDWSDYGMDDAGLLGNTRLSAPVFIDKLEACSRSIEPLQDVLRTAMAVPERDADARARIDELQSFLEEQIAAGAASKRQLGLRAMPFVLSTVWHVQSPKRWPVMHRQVRNVLQADGLLGRIVRGGDGYLAFARVYSSLSRGLGLDFWELEHLCLRIAETQGDADAEADSEDGGAAEEAPTQGRVWLYSPGHRAQWFDEFYEQGIMAIGWDELGDLTAYADAEAIAEDIRERYATGGNPFHQTLACQQFAREMEVGDAVFAKRGRHEIVGYGVVTSAYRFDPSREEMRHVRSVNWKRRGEWPLQDRALVTKTLTEISGHPQLLSELYSAIGLEANDAGVEEEADETRVRSAYDLDDAARELFMSRDEIARGLELLRYKKNLVLQGPPGVGKTYFAKCLTYLLLGERDAERVRTVQFHPSYAYEDFVQGYRPTADGRFALKNGPFMEFCDRALQDPSLPHVMIIDEINRANLSKVFGELMLLIEADKRSKHWATRLTYGSEASAFHVPENVYIIGTMNTADRSLALVDYALRRRFAFLEMRPGFEHLNFARHLSELGADLSLRQHIVERLQRVNERIANDTDLGRGFELGHSYFCRTGGQDADMQWYQRIVRTELQPLLEEYFFDRPDAAAEAVEDLLGDA